MPITESAQEYITQTFHQGLCTLDTSLRQPHWTGCLIRLPFSPMIRPNMLQRDAENILCSYGNLWNILETFRMRNVL